MKSAAAVISIAIVLSLAGSVSEAEVNTSTYEVRSGDTLWSIATEFNTTVNTIKRLNHLSSELIITSQVLKVPAGSSGNVSPTIPDNSLYTVQSGDTLFSIAKNHNMTVADLIEENQLSNHVIVTGQQLNVTGELNVPASTVPVSFGDSSWITNPIEIAMEQIGIPYVWGGSTPDGFDCSGFIYYVFKEAGLEIARTNAEDQHARSHYVASPIAGDLVFFENTYKAGISHVGIYLGNNQFIHANDGDGVQITSLSNAYWQKKFEGFRRFTGE